jgi:hypothetical protein
MHATISEAAFCERLLAICPPFALRGSWSCHAVDPDIRTCPSTDVLIGLLRVILTVALEALCPGGVSRHCHNPAISAGLGTPRANGDRHGQRFQPENRPHREKAANSPIMLIESPPTRGAMFAGRHKRVAKRPAFPWSWRSQ